MYTQLPTVRPYLAYPELAIKRRIVWEGSDTDAGHLLVNTDFPDASWIRAGDLDPTLKVGGATMSLAGFYNAHPAWSSGSTWLGSPNYLFYSILFNAWVVSEYFREPLEYTYTANGSTVRAGHVFYIGGDLPAIGGTSTFTGRGALANSDTVTLAAEWDAEPLSGGTPTTPPCGDFSGFSIGWPGWGAPGAGSGAAPSYLLVGNTVYAGAETSATFEPAKGYYIVKTDASGAWRTSSAPVAGVDWTFSYVYDESWEGETPAKADLVCAYLGRFIRKTPFADAPRYVFPTSRIP